MKRQLETDTFPSQQDRSKLLVSTYSFRDPRTLYRYGERFDPRRHYYVFKLWGFEKELLHRHGAWDVTRNDDERHVFVLDRVPKEIFMKDIMNESFYMRLLEAGVSPPPYDNFPLTHFQCALYREMFVARTTDRIHEEYIASYRRCENMYDETKVFKMYCFTVCSHEF